MNELIEFLKYQDVEYQTEKLLASCTTIGIGGSAKIFVLPDTVEKFTETLAFLYRNRIPFRILGNMSNILPSDDVIETVIVSTLKMNRVDISEGSAFAECGALFSKIILHAARRGLGGCESLFGIPGSVGGMLHNNAGAYGVAISDFLSAVELYDVKDDSRIRLKRDEIGFFYRDSEIKRQSLTVISATFNLRSISKQEIDQKIRRIKKQRSDTQPIGSKTLGSVFKRFDDCPASYMIDRCGLKGERCGKIVVSSLHAGFFLNEGGGTASDFLTLVKTVKNKVYERYGVILTEEFEYLS